MTLFAFPSEQTRLEALRTRLKLQFQHGALPTQEDYYLLINLLCDCVLVAQSLQARPAPPQTLRVSADDPLFLALEQRDEEVEQRLQSLQTKLDSLDQRVPATAPAAETMPAASSPEAQAPSAATPEVETPAAGEMETIGKAAVGDAQVVGVELTPAGAPGEGEMAAPQQEEAAAGEAAVEANPLAVDEAVAPAESSPPASEPASDEADAEVSRREEAAETVME
ncbi:hypothetical protein ABI908_04215, partial [Chromobacterium phragmitis]